MGRSRSWVAEEGEILRRGNMLLSSEEMEHEYDSDKLRQEVCHHLVLHEYVLNKRSLISYWKPRSNVLLLDHSISSTNLAWIWIQPQDRYLLVKLLFPCRQPKKPNLLRDRISPEIAHYPPTLSTVLTVQF